MKIKAAASILIIALIVSLLFVAFFFIPKRERLKRTEEDVARMESELAAKKAQLQRLKKEYIELQYDVEAIEKVAREKYNFCKSGEIVYKYSPEELSRCMGVVGPVGIEPTTR